MCFVGTTGQWQELPVIAVAIPQNQHADLDLNETIKAILLMAAVGLDVLCNTAGQRPAIDLIRQCQLNQHAVPNKIQAVPLMPIPATKSVTEPENGVRRT